jgi:polar amino acid transport system substrate-binding protein
VPSVAGEAIPFAIGEWPPYTSEQLPEYGLMTKIATAVIRDMKATPVYSFQPWVRCEEQVKAGKAFATFPYAITRKRKREFDFSDPMLVSSNMLFYNTRVIKHPFPVNDLEDLKSFRIGGVRGYYYTESFEMAGLHLEYVHEDEQNVRKLHAGRIDLAVMDRVLGWNLIRKLYPGERALFATVPRPLGINPMCFMISRTYPGSKSLRIRLNQAIRRVLAQPGIRALIREAEPRRTAVGAEVPLQKVDE